MHIVIMGAVISGMPTAYELKAKLGGNHRITVVNPLDYFQFLPSNLWLTVGWSKREKITFPTRPYLEKKSKWVSYAKIAFEKYFIYKMKKGISEPIYEKYVLKVMGIEKLD